MAQIKINQFTEYYLSEQEQLAATHYTNEQIQFLQNQIALISAEIIALVPDPNNYPAFIQEHGFKSGQLTAYQYLLDCNEATTQQLLTQAQQNQE